jgi:hypothetical protein
MLSRPVNETDCPEDTDGSSGDFGICDRGEPKFEAVPFNSITSVDKSRLDDALAIILRLEDGLEAVALVKAELVAGSGASFTNTTRPLESRKPVMLSAAQEGTAPHSATDAPRATIEQRRGRVGMPNFMVNSRFPPQQKAQRSFPCRAHRKALKAKRVRTRPL